MIDRPTAPALLDALPDEVLVAYFDAVHAAFLAAVAARGRCIDRDHRIGGHVVRLSSPDAVVLDTMGAALAHLRIDPQPSADLTIGMWHRADRHARHSPPSPWGWYARQHGAAVPHLQFNGHGELTAFRSRRITTAFRTSPHKLRILDSDRNQAFYWTEDVDRIPDYEYCAPLRKILAWWMSSRGHQIVHAAAVGGVAGGVLLAGRGGSGKSTTALACVGSPLRYAGDDCCLLTAGGAPFVGSLYNSAKLKTRADVARFPDLADAIHNPRRRDDEKAFLFLHRHRPDCLSAGFPLRALLIPRVTGRAAPRLLPATPAAGLAALVPSTLRLFPGLEREATRRMADVVARLPSYHLEVGPDLRAIPGVIADLLEDA
jgi:hypothetical protein